MASKHALNRLDERIRELEVANAEQTPRYVPMPGEVLLGMLERIFHPALTREMNAVERRYWRAGFELLRLLSRLRSLCAHMGFLDFIARGVRTSFIEWYDELNASRNYPSWNPLNECVLHEFKFHTRMRHPIDGHGVHQAEQIDHLLAALPFPRCSSWQKDFRAGDTTWPADIRDDVERRLIAAGSLTPDDVPPFDWGTVSVYQWMYPFPRDRDGRPTQEAFDKFDAENPPEPVVSPIVVVHPDVPFAPPGMDGS